MYKNERKLHNMGKEHREVPEDLLNKLTSTQKIHENLWMFKSYISGFGRDAAAEICINRGLIPKDAEVIAEMTIADHLAYHQLRDYPTDECAKAARAVLTARCGGELNVILITDNFHDQSYFVKKCSERSVVIVKFNKDVKEVLTRDEYLDLKESDLRYYGVQQRGGVKEELEDFLQEMAINRYYEAAHQFDLPDLPEFPQVNPAETYAKSKESYGFYTYAGGEPDDVSVWKEGKRNRARLFKKANGKLNVNDIKKPLAQFEEVLRFITEHPEFTDVFEKLDVKTCPHCGRRYSYNIFAGGEDICPYCDHNNTDPLLDTREGKHDVNPEWLSYDEDNPVVEIPDAPSWFRGADEDEEDDEIL